MENYIQELTLQDFFNQFKPYADAKTAYSFAKQLFACYLKEPAPYFVENDKIVFDEYDSDGDVHGSGYITPELGRYEDGEYFIRWCDAD